MVLVSRRAEELVVTLATRSRVIVDLAVSGSPSMTVGERKKNRRVVAANFSRRQHGGVTRKLTARMA